MRGEVEEWSDVDVFVVVKWWLMFEEFDRMVEVINKYVIEKGVVILFIFYIEKLDMSLDLLIFNVMWEGIKV